MSNQYIEEKVEEYKRLTFHGGHPETYWFRTTLTDIYTKAKLEVLEVLERNVKGKKYRGEPSAGATDATWAAHYTHNKVLDTILSEIAEMKKNV